MVDYCRAELNGDADLTESHGGLFEKHWARALGYGHDIEYR
jgi:hypothetical protein